jgi:hypothetical protein
MALPWLKIIDAVLGLTDVARTLRRRPPSTEMALADEPDGSLAAMARGGGALEARLAGVVVAALKEAFDRDHQRLALEREQLDAERARAERALRLELMRQSAEREIGRLRLLAGVAVASWLGTLLFSARLLDSGGAGRAALGIGWLLLLGALAAAFSAHTTVSRSVTNAGAAAEARDISAGPGGAAAPWLIVAGLAAIALGILIV